MIKNERKKHNIKKKEKRKKKTTNKPTFCKLVNTRALHDRLLICSTTVLVVVHLCGAKK